MLPQALQVYLVGEINYNLHLLSLILLADLDSL